ncbi:glutamate cysteine ligase, putative [Theileria equi strain WA]|uniref:Glutamate--cysteine ligase n=1 Tax=Theileria equi strain WA TaxID=1537102 RepID=L1LDV9_THEEQ|nr:glutamate cysteine ligase, putative [Theileria equi strain WA]EKX73627.1 glutamate cysteine ligase, putative [Theileria equi strain WA]|eukprot:XP_004833079.1 glutamate cysteine ligase, putative [Theileria equi strain WA]
MGFLQAGELVEDIKPVEEKVRQLGIAQFLNTLTQNVGRRDPNRLFGDELEYMLINVDSQKRDVQLLPRAPHILECIKDPKYAPKTCKLMPEYASYMVEGIPYSPYTLDSDYLPRIHESLKSRRKEIKTLLTHLGCNEGRVSTLSSFPLLGCPNAVYKGVCGSPDILRRGRAISQSRYTEDDIISPHVRFSSITNNIRNRRGGIEILIKAYEHGSDSTASESQDPTSTNHSANVHVENLDEYIRDQVVASDPMLSAETLLQTKGTKGTASGDHKNIHMDAIVFGMGMCCLQLTFSCLDINEARYLHDQMAVLAPLFIALTASTVVFRGALAATDTRWEVLCQAMDDVKASEKSMVQKSRFSSASLYIGNDEFLKKNYSVLNDNKVACLSSIYDKLVENGVDSILARHFAHIFLYQPLVVYKEDFDAVDCSATDAHFEVFQSTNWNSVRFKPPPVVKHEKEGTTYPIPWRVELRPCEIQIRDSENAVFLTAIPYIIKTLLREKWNLYVPLSLVDANIKRSSSINACIVQKFYMRTNIFENRINIKEMTTFDIFFGELGLINRCMQHLEADYKSGLFSQESYEGMKKSFEFIKDRCTGKVPTNAVEIRNFILNHPKYNHDGLVNREIVFDLVTQLAD